MYYCVHSFFGIQLELEFSRFDLINSNWIKRHAKIKWRGKKKQLQRNLIPWIDHAWIKNMYWKYLHRNTNNSYKYTRTWFFWTNFRPKKKNTYSVWSKSFEERKKKANRFPKKLLFSLKHERSTLKSMSLQDILSIYHKF